MRWFERREARLLVLILAAVLLAALFGYAADCWANWV
jgi:hypothetical protein